MTFTNLSKFVSRIFLVFCAQNVFEIAVARMFCEPIFQMRSIEEGHGDYSQIHFRMREFGQTAVCQHL